LEPGHPYVLAMLVRDLLVLLDLQELDSLVSDRLVIQVALLSRVDLDVLLLIIWLLVVDHLASHLVVRVHWEQHSVEHLADEDQGQGRQVFLSLVLLVSVALVESHQQKYMISG